MEDTKESVTYDGPHYASTARLIKTLTHIVVNGKRVLINELLRKTSSNERRT